MQNTCLFMDLQAESAKKSWNSTVSNQPVDRRERGTPCTGEMPTANKHRTGPQSRRSAGSGKLKRLRETSTPVRTPGYTHGNLSPPGAKSAHSRTSISASGEARGCRRFGEIWQFPTKMRSHPAALLFSILSAVHRKPAHGRLRQPDPQGGILVASPGVGPTTWL